MNGHVGLAAGSELDGLQIGAVVERILRDGGDGLGDHDLGDQGVVERVGTDGVDSLTAGRLRQGVGAGLTSGEDLQVVVAGRLVEVDQRAVEGGVEALIVALSGGVDLEGLQLGTTVERGNADVTDGVGHGDGLQVGAALERVIGHIGDLNALVSRGNADLGNGIRLGACLDRVGAVGQKLERQNVGGGVEVRIHVQILGEGVGSETHALVVGDLGAAAVYLGVPALEEACIVGLRNGNGEGELAVEEDGLSAALLHVVHEIGINVEDEVVLVGLPVCEEDHGVRAGKGGVDVLLTVTLGTVGYVVPAVEGESCQG